VSNVTRIDDRYATVPAALPETLPPLSRVEAQRIATKITRKFWPNCSRSYVYPLSRVRRVWLSAKPTKADNVYKGLGRLIHDLSHDVFSAVYRDRRAHDPLHAKYETDIAAFVAESGWMKRVTSPKPPKVKPTLEAKRLTELNRIESAIERWESKQRRARNALRKLAAKRRRLMRVLSANGDKNA
jgi:hypothetical protein